MEIEAGIIEDYHNNLIKDKLKLDFLFKKRGITKETIIKYKIGFDGERYTIPIKDSLGNYVNIRRWHPTKTPKILPYKKGYGGKRLFPIENLRKQKIILCEGEWDCLLLNQYGFNAITTTTGVSSWDDEWNKYFKDKYVVIIFDCQDVSKKAAYKIKDKIINYVKALKIVDLGLNENGEDITDWFVKYNKTTEELIELIKKTEECDLYEKVNLSEGLNSRYYNKLIKFNCVVIGKDLAPYIIPKKVEAVCESGPIENNKKCLFCPLANRTKIIKEYSIKDEILIKLINTNDFQVEGFLRQDLHLPAGRNCPGKYKINIIERQNVEDIKIIPEINFEMIDHEYVIRKAYYFGDNVKTNMNYLMRGTTTVDPKNQMGIHIIHKIEESQDNITQFQLTKEIKEQLKIFKPDKIDDEDSIKEKLSDIYTDFTYNITKIYNREDVLFATDLVYHSIINFKFLNNIITRGWVEAAIFGDTKAGKTETVRNIVKHYRAGEFITSGENTTRAGLLGGAQQVSNGRWSITWGKLPLNDRRLVILDECDKLGEDIIDLLSGVRSSGIAELIVILPQRTMARTRIIWIFNPKFGKINEYNYGIEIIRELFKKQQDISRLDFAVAVSNEDVPIKFINMRPLRKVKHKYLSEYCHNLVMFAWSRKTENIIFTKEAEDFILEASNKLANEFSSDIPLIVGAEIRIKLARLAVSLATRLYNTDETGENIIVLPVHVQIICNYLYKIYENHISGYKEFSQQRFREKSIGDTSTIDSYLKDEETINLLLDMQAYRVADIEDIFGIERKEAKDLIAYMRKNRLLKRFHNFYKKTKSFINYLKQRRQELKSLGGDLNG